MALVFNVRRSEPELIKPAKPTPNGVKSLSDWDDRVLLRDWMSAISFYNATTTSTIKDPAEIIKKALAEALVYYYPLAGRFKEQGPAKRLVVDCTSEGVLFVSADADVSLEQFGLIRPPFPCMKELLYNKPTDSTTTIACPIVVIQVTRLTCGGFIIAFAINHVMCDVVGAVQFVTAISELARGSNVPSLLPAWRRDLLTIRDCKTRDLKTAISMPTQSNDYVVPNDMTYRSFFFGEQELKAIRARLPEYICSRFTSFELISACVFHCRVVSQDHTPEEKVRAIMTVNARSKLVDPPLPLGYYGNTSISAVIFRPMQYFHDLLYVVEEVKKAKDGVTGEYVRSLIESSGNVTNFALNCPTYIISDLSRVGLSNLDFGMGRPVYAGPTNEVNLARPVMYMVGSTNTKGEHGRLITLYMPKDAMDKFDLTLHTLLGSSI